MSFTHTASEFT